MKNLILLMIGFCFLLISFNSSAQTIISSADFKSLIGYWSGTLTYLDYQNGEPFSLPVELRVVQIEETNNFTFYFSFPNEPHANSEETVSISDDGTMLKGNLVISKRSLDDAKLEVVTESMGTDDEKPATIRQTYIIAADVFIYKKDVLFEGTQEWLNRNEFNFKKVLKKE